ncbi:fatty acid hydroxylase-like protein [Fragilaria crotonensis]|nr:fatty acid hydroxylase-like protein [Fragilaria crotonensis]
MGSTRRRGPALCRVFFLVALVWVSEGFTFQLSLTRQRLNGHTVSSITASRSRPSAQSLATSSTGNDNTLEEVPRTLSQALDRFFVGPDRGPICVVGLLTMFTSWRFMMKPTLETSDALVFVASVVFWWFQEHIMHERLLHSEFDWFGKEVHEGHHNKPYFHVSIDPAWLILGWLALAHLTLRFLLPLDLALSATIGYAGAGLMYEWAHYMAHTRVKPGNAFWKQVKDNHIKHHLLDSRYWFAFSVPAIDDWFGTNPPAHHIKCAQRKEGQSP